MSTDSYDLLELCDAADVTPRTVRYYIQQGLLPSPDARGRGARYDRAHLDRIRLIKRLQGRHLPLAEIRAQLAELSDAAVSALVADPAAGEKSESALDYVRNVLSGSQDAARARIAEEKGRVALRRARAGAAGADADSEIPRARSAPRESPAQSAPQIPRPLPDAAPQPQPRPPPRHRKPPRNRDPPGIASPSPPTSSCTFVGHCHGCRTGCWTASSNTPARSSPTHRKEAIHVHVAHVVAARFA